MPRLYDFVKSQPFKGVHIAAPRFGNGEIDAAQRRDEESANLQWRHHQFKTRWQEPKRDFQRAMNQAFNRLANDKAGPWHWNEFWSDDERDLRVEVHIERLCDQARFHKAFDGLFQFSKDNEFQLENLAIIKGVLPPRAGVYKWALEHGVSVKFGMRAGRVLVEAGSPEKAGQFKDAWEPVFKPVIENGDGMTRWTKSTFTADRLTGRPPVLPDDFRDYLLGKCDFSAVRTLPRANARLPKPELACK